MTALVEDLEQVTPDQIKHFDHDAFQLVAEYHAAGWRSHMTSRGHVFLKSPDGKETANVSRESLRGRSGRNAAAPLKRWRRRQEAEAAARAEGAGSSFGDVDSAQQATQPNLPPRVRKALREHPDVLAYIDEHADRFDGPDAFGESIYIGIDLDEPRPWEKWTLADIARGVLIAHGPGITRNEALKMLRAEGKLPPATEDEIMASNSTICSECGFQAETLGSLVLHVRIKHTGFVCPECGKNTGHAGRSLAIHRESEHGIIPTSRAKALARKMRDNTCSECGEQYTTPQGLANHERTSHGRDVGQTVLDLARSLDRPLVTGDVMDVLGIKVTSSATSTLRRMVSAGLLVRVKRGQYTLAPETPAGTGDVPVTSPPDAGSVTDVLGDLPDEPAAQDMVAKIRAVVTPPLLAEVQRLRGDRDRLVHENEILTKELDDLRALLSMVHDAVEKKGNVMALPLVALEGRVVGEPQLKFADSGRAVARLRVKSADRRKNPETERWEDTEVLWVTVTVFGALAENVMESLVDGDQVVAIGKWSTAEWIDQQGNQRSAPRFVAQAIGPGLQFAPRRHSPETMAKHRPDTPPTGRAPQAEAAYGQRFADAAVAREPVQGGGAPSDDPWAT